MMRMTITGLPEMTSATSSDFWTSFHLVLICLCSISSIHLSPFNADQSAYVVYGSPICYIMWWRKTRGVAHTAPWEREEGDCLDRWSTSMVWLKELAVAGGRGPNEREKGRKKESDEITSVSGNAMRRPRRERER